MNINDAKKIHTFRTLYLETFQSPSVLSELDYLFLALMSMSKHLAGTSCYAFRLYIVIIFRGINHTYVATIQNHAPTHQNPSCPSPSPSPSPNQSKNSKKDRNPSQIALLLPNIWLSKAVRSSTR
jgi:hypothetical protein